MGKLGVSSSRPDGFASVSGSPGARVRFMGFFTIFWPFILVVFFAGWLLNSLFPVTIAQGVAALLLLALLGVAWMAFDSAGKRFQHFLKGARGEEIVARELALLPAGWDVFHGVPRSGAEALAGGGDFDHIIVGSDSMFLIETKNWDGPVTIERGMLKVRGRIPRRSPVAQVRKAALELAALLEDAMPNGIAVTPIVCFAGDGFAEDEERVDDVWVCNARVLRRTILEAEHGGIDEPSRELIVETLIKRMYG